MFGFKARAKERAASEAADVAVIKAAVHSQMRSYLAAALAEFEGAEPYATCAFDMQIGLDAVLLRNVNALDEQITSAGDGVSAGAMLGSAALGTVLFTRSLDHPRYVDDFRHVLQKAGG